jgi:hypothetical protein
MAKPPKHLAVPDCSGKPLQSGKVGVYFRSYEYISNQTTINHTRPTQGGTIRHHQIALEHHRKAEKLEFIFVLTNTYPTRPPSTTHAQRGAERSCITRLLWKTTAKRKGCHLAIYENMRPYSKQSTKTITAPETGGRKPTSPDYSDTPPQSGKFISSRKRTAHVTKRITDTRYYTNP